jgi:acetyl esterase
MGISTILFISVLLLSLLVNVAVHRPLKVIFLEFLLNGSFRYFGVPNPAVDPYGWIEGVRKMHLLFHHTTPTQYSDDMRVVLEDGRQNWIRVVYPDKKDSHTHKDLPVFVWFHGGGYCLGNYTFEDEFLFPLAKRLNAIAISVDYRLAPENKFPAAISDAYLSFNWIYENAHRFGGDRKKIFVGGESSGATLSLSVSYLLMQNERARDADGHPKIRGVYLNSPGFLMLHSDSYNLYREGYILCEDWIKVFSTSYVNKLEDWRNPTASPLNLKNLSGFPTALVHVAGLDVVRDGSLYFVERLVSENEGKVDHKVFPNIPHAGISSFRWLFKTESNQAIDHLQQWVHSILK